LRREVFFVSKKRKKTKFSPDMPSTKKKSTWGKKGEKFVNWAIRVDITGRFVVGCFAENKPLE